MKSTERTYSTHVIKGGKPTERVFTDRTEATRYGESTGGTFVVLSPTGQVVARSNFRTFG